jgi:hypothetical protein
MRPQVIPVPDLNTSADPPVPTSYKKMRWVFFCRTEVHFCRKNLSVEKNGSLLSKEIVRRTEVHFVERRFTFVERHLVNK